MAAVKHQAGDVTGGVGRGGQEAVCTHLTQLNRKGGLRGAQARSPRAALGGSLSVHALGLPWGPRTHDQVLLLPVDLHGVDGVGRGLPGRLPSILVQRRDAPEAHCLDSFQNPCPSGPRTAHMDTHPQAMAKESLQEGGLAHSAGPYHLAQENVSLRLSLLLVQPLLPGDCGQGARMNVREGLPGRHWLGAGVEAGTHL